MAKAQAEELQKALLRIESGQVDLGATLLRAILREAGFPAPAFIVPARERPPQGKER